MGFPPIHAAFLQTDPERSSGAASWHNPLDDAYQAWKNAIASMEQLLYDACESDRAPLSEGDLDRPVITPTQGLILSGPTPVLYQPQLAIHFQSCLWTSHRWTQGLLQLLPSDSHNFNAATQQPGNIIPIAEHDPLRLEQFCVVLTPDFSWAVTLSHSPPEMMPFFAMTFTPSIIDAILAILTTRIKQHRPAQVHMFEQMFRRFQPHQPNYIWPMRYGQHILTQSARFETPSRVVKLETEQPPDDTKHEFTSTPSIAPENENTEVQSTGETGAATDSKHDIELLQAIAHEIRTPLATIQTLTRLLIRRKDLPQDVINRLESIQQECAHQIDRFSLIFRAIELTATPSASLHNSLTTMSLQQLFNHKMERWESILERRSLEFDVKLPDDLPAIAIRDPTMLDQVLTGLIEQLSQTLPLNSKMSLRVTLAGDQLKLQLRSSIPNDDLEYANKSMLKAVGQLLMLQPETGSLSLSLPATKQIFNFLGGKLTVRQSSPTGETLTMYLPLDSITSSIFQSS